jgi:hypothetical protein
MLDLLDASLGSIEHISGWGDPLKWVALTCRHTSGVVSQAALSIAVRTESVWRCDLYGPEGSLSFDAASGRDEDGGWATVRREFAAAVRSGMPHQLDVHRGLLIQELIDRAARSLN